MELQNLSKLNARLVKAPVDQVLEIEEIVRSVIQRRVAEAKLANE